MSLSKKVAKLQDSVLEAIIEAGKDAKEDPSALHKVVSDAEAAIIKATKERDFNSVYQTAGQVRSDFTASLNDFKRVEKAKAALALAVLDEDNLSAEDSEALDSARSRVYEIQKGRKKDESV